MASPPTSASTEPNLGAVIEQVAKEKGIERQVLVESIEAAIHKAA